MKWAVYCQIDDEIDCVFFKTEVEARRHVDELVGKARDASDEGVTPDWDITLLQVRGEVRQIPFDGSYRLYEVA